MPDMFKAGSSPRAQSSDLHAGVGVADPVAHLAASLVAGGKGLEEGETIVGRFPPGATYRLIVDETGAHVVRREPDTKTVDAGPWSAAAIQAANERFWGARSRRR